VEVGEEKEEDNIRVDAEDEEDKRDPRRVSFAPHSARVHYTPGSHVSFAGDGDVLLPYECTPPPKPALKNVVELELEGSEWPHLPPEVEEDESACDVREDPPAGENYCEDTLADVPNIHCLRSVSDPNPSSPEPMPPLPHTMSDPNVPSRVELLRSLSTGGDGDVSGSEKSSASGKDLPELAPESEVDWLAIAQETQKSLVPMTQLTADFLLNFPLPPYPLPHCR